MKDCPMETLLVCNLNFMLIPNSVRTFWLHIGTQGGKDTYQPVEPICNPWGQCHNIKVFFLMESTEYNHRKL